MADWLTDSQARALIGLESGDTSDDTAFGGALEAARDWVESKRPDLVVAGDPLAEPPTADEFVPNDAIKLGTAMLAHRWYQRRTTPLGTAQFSEFGGGRSILRYDPDIARLLGIGTEGAFMFGAAVPVVEVLVDEVP
jgi:hypothetical protein